MEDRINYYQFDRDKWHSFYPNGRAQLSQENLNDIRGLNDRISIDDVEAVYLPLIQLLKLRYAEYQQWQQQKLVFYKWKNHGFHLLLALQVP